MSTKRLVVLVLTVGIAVLGVIGFAAGTAEPAHFWIFAVGIVLGTLYVIRGGSLPDWAYRGRRLNRDDDPSNLSPRLYLPILFAVIAIVAAAVWIFGR